MYVAIGRRLGYPLKLVAAYSRIGGRLFARWDSPGECFNIEGTNRGLNCFTDDHYRTGLFELPPHVEASGGFLLSKTPRQELADFLMTRGHCWLDHKDFRRSAEATAWASVLFPSNPYYLNRLKKTLNEWMDSVDERKPPGFPQIFVTFSRRQYPDVLPLRLEQDMLALEAIEKMLGDPDQQVRWWRPMRDGVRLREKPLRALAKFTPQRCTITFDCEVDLAPTSYVVQPW